MPDIDLEPSDYTKRDPRTGQWRARLYKRADMWWGYGVSAFIAITFTVIEAFQIPRADLGFVLTIAFFSFTAGSCLSFLFPRFFFTRDDH